MKLNYKSYGAGEPLVILHGLFGMLDNWHTLARQFGERYQVFAIDQRNHGYSPHSAEFNYQLMAADLAEFLDDRGIERASLIGHSMGGKTVMRFSLDYRERTDRLIVVDIAPKAYRAGHEDIFAALTALDPASFQNRNEAEAALAASIPDQAVRQFLLKNLTRGEAGGFRWKMNLAALRANYDEINRAIEAAGQFKGETLFVRGERSRYIRDEDMPEIRRLFPRAELVTVAGAGHWVHAEAPAEFARVVLDFLSR